MLCVYHTGTLFVKLQDQMILNLSNISDLRIQNEIHVNEDLT